MRILRGSSDDIKLKKSKGFKGAMVHDFLFILILTVKGDGHIPGTIMGYVHTAFVLTIL